MHSDNNGREAAAAPHPSSAWTQTILPMTGGPERIEALRKAMAHPAYPISSAYDPGWTCGNSMGPIPTWLAEDLAPAMHFKPGQRVLDLGCGAAITSVFLARDYGLQVWAADLWIDPGENAARIEEAGCSDNVTPLRVEAHRLPFALGYFDAIVSFDAYHYWGTDVRYLSYLAQFVKPGGRIGIVSPGNAIDPDEPGAILPPPEIAEANGADWYSWRSAEWWGRHWSRTLCLDVELAEMLEGGHATWLRQCDAIDAYCPQAADSLADRAMMDCKAGQSLGFCKVVAQRNGNASLHFGPNEFATRIA